MNSMSAIGRVMSRDSTGVTVTPAASDRTVCSSRPSVPATGTTSTSASCAPATLVTRPVRPSPVRRTPVIAASGPVDSGTARAPVTAPAARSGTVPVSPARSSATVASTALDRYGTGAAARPISSMTTAASRVLAPAPPRDSGTSSPASPSSAATVFHTPEKSAGAASYAVVTTDAGQRSVSMRRTLSRRASSVSEYSRSVIAPCPSTECPCPHGVPAAARAPARRRRCAGSPTCRPRSSCLWRAGTGIRVRGR